MAKYRLSKIRGMRTPFMPNHFASFWKELNRLGYVLDLDSGLIELTSDEDLAKVLDLLNKYHIEAELSEVTIQLL
jgi:hypothetical protein